MASTLRVLAELILKNVDAIEARTEKLGVQYPSLDEPFTPGTPDAQSDSEIARDSAIIAAAAYQLLCSVRSPGPHLYLSTSSFQLTAAIRISSELHITDILREAGPSGLHVKDIAAKHNVDPLKLTRILRYLATHHYYREIAPDVYTNNRHSSILDKGTPVDELLANPDAKYVNPQAANAAFAAFIGDESAKAGCYFYESLTDPATAFSGDAAHSPCSRAMTYAFPALGKDPLPLWEFFEREDVVGKGRTIRFGVSMESWSRVQPIAEVLGGFKWSSLPPSSVVVDVGGGVGSMAAIITRANPQLHIVVQDRPAVIAEGVKRWQQTNKDALDEGRVVFQPQDFFAPQPAHSIPVAVFFLANILHDWADEYSTKILQQIRAAATVGENCSRLLILDTIVPYACRTSTVSGSKDANEEAVAAIKGTLQAPAPPPLLPNMGGGAPIPYSADLAMFGLVNGQERTIGHVTSLLRGAGWNPVHVNQSLVVGQYMALLEAVPI